MTSSLNLLPDTMTLMLITKDENMPVLLDTALRKSMQVRLLESKSDMIKPYRLPGIIKRLRIHAFQ